MYRFYRATVFNRHKEYAMVRCVDIESFVAQIASLEPTETEVISSVLENFLEKAATSTEPDKRRDELQNLIKTYMKNIEESARKNPGTKFVLIEPILRPKIPWYDDEIDAIKKLHKEEIRRMGVVNVFGIDIISRASQNFENDGVHLTKPAGLNFVEGMLEAAEKIFQASFVDLEAEFKTKKPTKPTVEERLCKLENDFEETNWQNNLLFARTREELDTATNKTKEDRVIMTGLTSSIPPPKDKVQRSQWIRQVVVDTLKKIKPDFDGKIGFVNQGKNNGREIPMVEVKVGSVEIATGLRKAFADKRKGADGNLMGRLYMANSVTLSTRVRIDVMKAIAKKLTSTTESAHVAAFSSRPILHVRTKGEGPEPVTRAYTFIDSIIKFGSILRQDDLEEAYRRAGVAFRGQLGQHFVVLRDQDGVRSGGHGVGPTASGSSKSHAHGGGKRSREEESDSTGKDPKNRKK
jgi:hypothetical protein